MKIFIGMLFGVFIAATPTMAQEAPKAKETKWSQILTCTNIKTGKRVLTEKYNGNQSIWSQTLVKLPDLRTGKVVWIFPMGADVVCFQMDKDTFEKRQ